MKIRSLMIAMLIAFMSLIPVQAKSKSASHTAGHRGHSKTSKHRSHKARSSKPRTK